MPTWMTNNQYANNQDSVNLENALGVVSDLYSSVKNRVIGEVSSYFGNGTSVVGINVSQIPTMKAAIKTYVDGINAQLDKLETDYDPAVAFKGSDVVPAIKSFMVSAKESCKAIVSHLLYFSDQLTEIEKAYAAKDTETAETIKSTASSMSSSYGAYSSSEN